MAKMSYQQARAIRNMPKLSELIRQNAVGGMSTGQSIKQAFKEKFNVSKRLKAKVVGIKEKFDPMNIAKFMTGGSRTVAALVGRMTGRSQEDIENFAGQAKSVRGVRNTAEKIGALPQGGSSGITSTLKKMYSFMAKANEDSIRRRELDANREEERQIEDERRHKELLAALGVEGTTPTATPIEQKKDTGMLATLLSFVTAAVASLKKWVQDLFANFDIWKYLNKISWIGSLVKFLGSNLFRFVFMNPALLGVLSAAALAAYLVSEVEDAKLFDEKGKPTGLFNTLDAAQKAAGGKGIAPTAGKEPFDKIMDEGGSPSADKAFKKSWLEKKDQGAVILPEEAQAVKVKYGIDWPMQQIKSSVELTNPSASPVLGPNEMESTQATPAGKEVKGYLKRSKPVTESQAREIQKASGLPNSGTPPSAEVRTKGQQLNNAVKENVDTKINNLTTKSVSQSSVNNTTNVTGQNNPAVAKTIPSVRNLEETYASIIYDNIRVT